MRDRRMTIVIFLKAFARRKTVYARFRFAGLLRESRRRTIPLHYIIMLTLYLFETRIWTNIIFWVTSALKRARAVSRYDGGGDGYDV